MNFAGTPSLEEDMTIDEDQADRVPSITLVISFLMIHVGDSYTPSSVWVSGSAPMNDHGKFFSTFHSSGMGAANRSGAADRAM